MALFDRPSQPAGSKQGEKNIYSYMIVNAHSYMNVSILALLQKTKEKQNESDTMYLQVLNVLFLIATSASHWAAYSKYGKSHNRSKNSNILLLRPIGLF